MVPRLSWCYGPTWRHGRIFGAHGRIPSAHGPCPSRPHGRVLRAHGRILRAQCAPQRPWPHISPCPSMPGTRTRGRGQGQDLLFGDSKKGGRPLSIGILGALLPWLLRFGKPRYRSPVGHTTEKRPCTAKRRASLRGNAPTTCKTRILLLKL